MTRTLRAIDMSRKIRDSLMYPRKMCAEGPTFRVRDCRSAPLMLLSDPRTDPSIFRSILKQDETREFFFPSTQLCGIPLNENILPTFSFLYLVQVQLVPPFLLQNIET